MVDIIVTALMGPSWLAIYILSRDTKLNGQKIRPMIARAADWILAYPIQPQVIGDEFDVAI